MYHNPLFIKTFYLCEIADEQLLWRNYNRVFDKLYVFYCVVSGNLLHTFYFRSGKKCCCTAICGHGNFYWIVSSWFGKNGFKRERSFMIQILYFRNNNKILFFPRLLWERRLWDRNCIYRRIKDAAVAGTFLPATAVFICASFSDWPASPFSLTFGESEWASKILLPKDFCNWYRVVYNKGTPVFPDGSPWSFQLLPDFPAVHRQR